MEIVRHNLDQKKMRRGKKQSNAVLCEISKSNVTEDENAIREEEMEADDFILVQSRKKNEGKRCPLTKAQENLGFKKGRGGNGKFPVKVGEEKMLS